jgi:hypothetical protein
MKKLEQFKILRNQAEQYYNRGKYLLAKQKYLECLELTRPGTIKDNSVLECIEIMNEHLTKEL